MKNKIILILLYILNEYMYSYSFKLNNTYIHESPVDVMSSIKIYYASHSLNYLASGSRDGTIKIWDITNEEVKFNFNKSNGGHSKDILSLVSYSNGLLASGS